MILLQANGISKSYGVDVILDGVSFSVEKGDRIGVVGPNGMGKTTLLSMIAGDIQPSGGSFYIRDGITVGYLKQRDNFLADGTVIDEAEKSIEKFRTMEDELSELENAVSDSESPTFRRNVERYNELLEKFEESGGYTYRSELRSVLASMGFPEDTYDRKIATLSGGERTRLALACLLLNKPDVLMLDEPTNHLDLTMLDWLERYLRSYKGTMIVVSHDRYFLDRLVSRIIDVRDTRVTAYRGNYSDYVVKRNADIEARTNEYKKQQEEIARQENMIRRFKERGTEKLAKRAKSREKRLEHIDRIERPTETNFRMNIDLESEYKSGNDVLLADELAKSFGEKSLFKSVSFDIKRQERICIIGDNGVGKTTLLRILIGEIKPDSGYLRIGHNVNIGYYDQGQLLLDDSESVIGEMKNAYPLISDTEMRSILGRFLFRGDDVFKTVGSLSGGEKAKLSLLKLMLSGANTLILDEPTNHLDIESREAVEQALDDYDGTIVIVSHDRYLLSTFPDRILELTHGGIAEYKGKFEYYLEKSGRYAARNADVSGESGHNADRDGALTAEEERRQKKEQEAEERRRTREVAKIEDDIAALEDKIFIIEGELCAEENINDLVLLRKLGDELEDSKLLLDDLYNRWGELQR